MGYSVSFADEAERDKEAIVIYLLDTLKSRQAASHFLNELEAARISVATELESYPPCREERLAAMGYRKVFFMNYVALYRLEEDMVVIAHIFHQTQDYARLV